MGNGKLAQMFLTTPAAGGGNYIKHGHGVMVVKSLLYKEDMTAGEGFIAELIVDSVEPYMGADGKPIPCNPPGSTVSFVQLFDKFGKTAVGNTKAFLDALYGEPLDGEASFARMQKVTGPSNPARGISIKFSTYEKMTKSSGKLLVLPKWEHIEQTPEEVKATRERLKL